MNKRTPISKIMTSDPISVNPSNNLMDVAKIFKERNIHHIPVVSGDELIGIISKNDINRISFLTANQDEKANTAIYNRLDIEQVMTKQIETVQMNSPIKEAAELFARGKFHALPVLEGATLAGIVTTTDVINYLLEQY